MTYHSLNGNTEQIDFEQATVRGQAPDKGLYFPETIPVFPKHILENLEKFSKEEIALAVIKPFVGHSIPAAVLERIVSETVNFDFPLVSITEDLSALELYHGPTLAFKDVGARFMSRCLGYFVRNNDRRMTVLVATSGDTGGAVASGFHDVDGIDVVILYPSGKVSSVQELQLTTPGKNISALEVNGSFDDCQRLVKQAFADTGLNEQVFLTSANSINVARWLPQQFYYFFALRQWADKKNYPVISVPSGNFGNIAAGLMAYRTGLPIPHFIAACNANDVFHEYLQTEKYHVKEAIATLSNAMDVGNPSNFPRVMELLHNDIHAARAMITSYMISDAATKETLKTVYRGYHYLLDPHGAVGFASLKNYLLQHPGSKGIVMETAHPVKFYDVVESIINEIIPMPEAIRSLSAKESKSIKIEADYKTLENYLLMKQ